MEVGASNGGHHSGGVGYGTSGGAGTGEGGAFELMRVEKGAESDACDKKRREEDEVSLLG